MDPTSRTGITSTWQIGAPTITPENTNLEATSNVKQQSAMHQEQKTANSSVTPKPLGSKGIPQKIANISGANALLKALPTLSKTLGLQTINEKMTKLCNASLKSISTVGPQARISVDGTKEEIKANGNEADTDFFCSMPLDKVKIPDTGKTKLYMNCSEQERIALDKQKFDKIQTFFDDQITLNESNADPEALKDLTGEVLAKALVYLHPDALKKPIKLPIPGGGSCEFSIKHHKMENSHLPYIILTPQGETKAEPWLVVRGTDPNIFGKAGKGDAGKSAFESVLADFVGRKGVSNEPVDNNIQKFINEIKTATESELNINLAGHSLGGEFVSHLATKLGENKEIKLGTTYAYNAPGVPKATKELYDKLDNKPTIKTFLKDGDAIGGCGQHFLNHDNVFVVKQGNSWNPATKHCEIDLHKEHTQEKCDVKAEENRAARRLLVEGARVAIGGIMRAGVSATELIFNKTYSPWVDEAVKGNTHNVTKDS